MPLSSSACRFRTFSRRTWLWPRRGPERCPLCFLSLRRPRTSARSHAPRYIPLARRPQRKCRHHTLISFIWSPGNPLPAGTGGSENYTVGQVRELTRRGIAAQVVTVGLGTSDGRDDFADVPFLALPTLAAVSELDSTVVFVNEPHTVPTMHPAFVILHNPPPIRERERAFAVEGTKELALIATSRYAAALWSAYLDVDIATISVVYPFAEPSFAAQPRPGRADGKTRILFAGRLSPEKGIYTLLETLHIDIIEQDPGQYGGSDGPPRHCGYAVQQPVLARDLRHRLDRGAALGLPGSRLRRR